MVGQDAEDPFPIGAEVVFREGGETARATVVGRPAPGEDPGSNPRSLPWFGLVLRVSSAQGLTALEAVFDHLHVWLGSRRFEIFGEPISLPGSGPVRDVGVTLVEV